MKRNGVAGRDRAGGRVATPHATLDPQVLLPRSPALAQSDSRVAEPLRRGRPRCRCTEACLYACDLRPAYGVGVSTVSQYVESGPKGPPHSGVVAYWEPWP